MKKQESLPRIARHLMLNASFEGDCSLFHGKMGIVIFFFQYARYTQKAIYEDFAEKLLEEIYAEINVGLDETFENGLCGIAWGIEYLIQQQFVEGDSNATLLELDQRIVERDVRKIKNIELNSGLKGLMHYILLRYNNPNSKPTLFNKQYLSELLKNLTSIEKQDTELCDMIDLLKKIQQNESYIYRAEKLLEQLIGISEFDPEKEFDSLHSIGLANKGYAGIAWNLMKSSFAINSSTGKLINSSNHPKLYCLTTTSRASAYGIGSYVDQVIQLARESNIDLTIIELHGITKEIHYSIDKGYAKIVIPPVLGNSNASDCTRDYYCRNIAYLLAEFIPQSEKPVFHLNFMENTTLPIWLKKRFNAKILLTVHYTSWSFDLLGDRKRLKKILNAKKEENNEFEERIQLQIENNRKLISQCDQIIAISNQSYKDIKAIYQVKPEQLILVNNGLTDGYKKMNDSKKAQLKKKYHINPQERIVLFAGRLDEVKGISFLLKAFHNLLRTEPNIRLVIAGEGNLDRWIEESKQFESKISFTGKLDKKELYQFYKLSDIGVVCSIHEEFGFVAIEMMMHELPIIVSDTGGLQEIVDDRINGLKVKVKMIKKKRAIDSKELTTKMNYLLHHPDVCLQLGQNGRNKFIRNYSFPPWSEQMKNIYNQLHENIFNGI